jgi:acetylornithine deacetylase/succinyl-diaminopimelate desuccinylase-like protein
MTGRVGLLIVVMAMSGLLPVVPAESTERPLSEALRDPSVVAALDDLTAHRGETAESLREMGAIRSPSGEEQERARWVAERMRAIGLSDVRVDSGPNAVGIIPGRSGKALVFVSTLDDLATVAENQEKSGPPRIEGDRAVGPGTNTSSTTAAMLAAAAALVSAGLVPEHDLVFAAVAQEETGLVGMKKLYEELGEHALGYVDVLGDGRRISYGAIVIHWWKVVGEGPAGHTLGGGLPNVNQGLARAIDRIFALPQPEREKDRRTVLNISMVRSGAVFNHKPETGWFSLDIRSLDASTVEQMEEGVREILAAVGEETGIRLRMEPFQLTPGGQLPGARDSVLVRASEEIARHLGFDPTFSDAGSSNMNVAIAGGTPAIGLGGERGGARGTPEEWASIPAMMDSARHVLLLAATVGGARGAGK